MKKREPDVTTFFDSHSHCTSRAAGTCKLGILLPKTNSRLQLSPGKEKLTKSPSLPQRLAQVMNQSYTSKNDVRALSYRKLATRYDHLSFPQDYCSFHRAEDENKHRDLQQEVQRLAHVMNRSYTSKNVHSLSSRRTCHQIINERNLPLSTRFLQISP